MTHLERKYYDEKDKTAVSFFVFLIKKIHFVITFGSGVGNGIGYES